MPDGRSVNGDPVRGFPTIGTRCGFLVCDASILVFHRACVMRGSAIGAGMRDAARAAAALGAATIKRGAGAIAIGACRFAAARPAAIAIVDGSAR